jgi:hypothetical protein
MNLGAWSAPTTPSAPVPKSIKKTVPSPIKSIKKTITKPYEGSEPLSSGSMGSMFGAYGANQSGFSPFTSLGTGLGKSINSTRLGKAQNKVQIEVLLSKELEAKWSDKLKSDIADVVVRMVN